MGPLPKLWNSHLGHLGSGFTTGLEIWPNHLPGQNAKELKGKIRKMK